MKVYHINHKPYLKERIVATLIDYAIYTIVCFLYIRLLGTETDEGKYVISGTEVLPIAILWFYISS